MLFRSLSSLEELPPLQPVGGEGMNGSSVIQAMEQNIEATLNQATIQFSDAGDAGDSADSEAEHDVHPVSVARGELREDVETGEAGNRTSEENTEQTQEPMQASERTLGDAND